MAAVLSGTRRNPGDGLREAEKDSGSFGRLVDELAERMPQACKGMGYSRVANRRKDDVEGIMPYDDTDPRVLQQSFLATKALRKSVKAGMKNPSGVMKSLNPNFLSNFGNFMAAMDAPGASGSGWMRTLFQQVEQALGELGKNVNLTVPLTATTQGLVPYDLVNPARLIYPVYTPLRNKIPRVPGQGTSRRVNVVTGISGSQTGGGTGGGSGAVIDISLADVPNASMQFPGGQFPTNMPNTGLQSAVALNIPYQFFGMSEALSWLAQFAGQGYQDISALANLMLLQEFMLMEEYQMIAGSNVALTAPTTAPTITTRVAGSNETVLPAASHMWVVVTAANYFGETVMSTVSADGGAANGTTQVMDVTLPQTLPPGALFWNVYVNNQAATTPARTALFRYYSQLGGQKLTLQGPTIPNTGTVPPAADSGTSGANRMLGLIPVLTGQVSTGASNYPTGAGWQAGYYQGNIGSHLSIAVLNNMLNGLYSGSALYGTGFGAFRASPSELIGASTDIMNLSNDIVQQGQANNYQILIDKANINDVVAGAAISQFVNPVTRELLKLLVHPWWPQGTAVAMSYQVPYSWSNVSNIWEMVMVQDYLSVSWPVIDPTFRYSMFMYGQLLCNAPQYCGILTGLAAHDTTPFS